jgi:hypothetical protein
LVSRTGAGSDLTYHYDGRASYDLDGETITKYVWDFGDNTKAEGPVVDHTYTAPGAYIVRLYVMDPPGAQGQFPVYLGQQLRVTSVKPSSIPHAVGDEFDVVSVVRNDTPGVLHCVNFGRAPDIRPAASFTTVSTPPLAVDNTLQPGDTFTASFRFKLKAPIPDSFYVYVDAFGGGSGGCPGANHLQSWGDGTFFINPPPGYKPFASWSALVSRLFKDLVGRVPTVGESSDWVGRLTAKTATPGSLVAFLRASADNRSNVDPVDRLYRAYFLRIPDQGGLVYWIGRKRAGTSLDAASAAFAGSGEFTKRYGTLTNRAFVNLVYTNVLGRPGETSGVNFWTGQLDAKKKTRGQMMTGFSESAESVKRQAANVNASVLYSLLLGRPPTHQEAAATVVALDGGVAPAATALLALPEYATHVT